MVGNFNYIIYLTITKFTHYPTNKKPHECGALLLNIICSLFRYLFLTTGFIAVGFALFFIFFALI